MSREEDLHLITAYALGELQGSEKERIEALIQKDEVLQQTVKEIRATAGIVSADLGSPVTGLSQIEKARVEKGWRDLAAKDSRSNFYRRTVMTVSALAAAVFAFMIVVPNYEKFTRTQTDVAREAAPPPMAPPQKVIADSDRSAVFLKMEKKEVNAEVGSTETYGNSMGKDSLTAAAPASKSVSARTKAASGMKLPNAVPVSVLFGGDGESIGGVPDGQSLKNELRNKTSDFVSCYQRTLNGRPDTKGKLMLRWGVKKGRATGVSVMSSTLGHSVLENCIVSVVKSIHFDPDSNGARVVMPFHFMSPN